MSIQQVGQDFQLLLERKGRPGFWPRFLALAIVLAVIYASLTSIIYWTPYFGINPSAEPVREGLIAIVVALTALLLAIYWQEMESGAKKPVPHHAGLVGSIVGVFASGCAICQPIWLVWLGLGQASLFLIDLSVWISLVSIALLLYSLHVKLNENCRI